MRRRLRTVGRLATLLAVVAVVVAPLAVAYALTTTRVHDTIGVSPATFSITTSGRSELRLGIAGTVTVPRAKGPFGLVAQVDAPTDDALPSGNGDLASLVSPQMLEVYAGLYHHPNRAIDGYVGLLRHQLVVDVVRAELVLTVVGAAMTLLVRRLLPGSAARYAGVAALALALTTSAAVVVARTADGRAPTAASYPLPALDNTAARGATTDSPVLRLLLVPCVRSSCALRALIARTSLRCQISLDEPVWRRSGALRCTHAEHANRSIASHAGH